MSDPNIFSRKNFYHLFMRNADRERDEREWVLRGHSNTQATAAGDWKDVRSKANDLLHDGSAFAVIRWKYSRDHGWMIETIHINSRIQTDGYVGATDDRI
jgi:hypothetical protein